jgi:A/G-specific adenine glycosylase
MPKASRKPAPDPRRPPARDPARDSERGTRARRAASARTAQRVPPLARARPTRLPRAATEAIAPERVREFGRRLRAWYRANCRDLPWRRTRDPYRVLVSELMLQQTQVSRVLPKYEEFLGRFPTLGHVAAAQPAHVMEAWSGLGYYARARNLHRLARHVTRDGGAGALPADPALLRTLPGIGAYTAGAVASFAYERRAPLVDTNVARVLRRVFAPHLDPKTGPGMRALWQIAERTLPRRGRDAWAHNQALMELGALVCTARARHCTGCPVTRVCATHAAHGCDEEDSSSRKRDA